MGVGGGGGEVLERASGRKVPRRKTLQTLQMSLRLQEFKVLSSFARFQVSRLLD